ncbi:MAG: hypothetical protein K9K30_03180 [Burkholderiaceae bacterium]|nr:hypothetical protein [Burkholderiaceae bacterium]MCF8184175.1 hypothetical protein [Polynucleobacter sp.]
MKQYYVRRDTASWNMQVWLSFGLAMLACLIGVWHMPSEGLDRAFLAIGFLFCLFATLALSKLVRDNRDEKVDTGSWVMTVWVAFFSSVAMTSWGLLRMNIGDWEKGFMVVSWLFLVSAAFTLAKTLRDKQEADYMEAAANAQGSEPAVAASE